MTSLLPITIRPHLVSFFFHEVKGEEVRYLKYRSKAFTLHKSAALNAIISIVMIEADIPVKPSNLHILLDIDETESNKQFRGTIYQPVSGQKHFLKVPEDTNKVINDLMEDMFRMSFFYYVQGHIENRSSKEITLIDAIYKFMEKYELLEHGFNMDSLRRMYYRMLKNNGTLNHLGSK